ncbi:hydrolase [Thioalkalivibrio paradoxus]|uniref:hydrolase n=1 Tax=Thioalkalivibrio paradoxus TaxID=108010 RepID=UPI00022C4AD6|nr:hydrolase [Thioalkalivibrio paradoxus]
MVRPVDSERPFRPAWWLPGAHLQTIVPNLSLWKRRPMLRRERITLPDDDFLSLDWAPDPGGPVVLLLHGLGGSSRSAYAVSLLRALHAHGFWAGVMHFRGAGGEPNRKLRGYHMAEADDPREVVMQLRRRYPRRLVAAVGVSLGGSALLHALARDGGETLLDCAVAVSVPYRLPIAERCLNRGVARLYQRRILEEMKRQWRRKCRVLARLDLCSGLDEMRSFRQFDARITAPIHGFADADDYYERASSIHVLGDIRVPTLLIHAANDPFMTPDGLPAPEDLPEQVVLECHRSGGHVGFLERAGRRYLARRIPAFLSQHLQRDHDRR